MVPSKRRYEEAEQHQALLRAKSHWEFWSRIFAASSYNTLQHSNKTVPFPGLSERIPVRDLLVLEKTL